MDCLLASTTLKPPSIASTVHGRGKRLIRGLFRREPVRFYFNLDFSPPWCQSGEPSMNKTLRVSAATAAIGSDNSLCTVALKLQYTKSAKCTFCLGEVFRGNWLDRLLLHSNHLQGHCRSNRSTSQQRSVRGDNARPNLSSSRQAPILRQLPATHELGNKHGDHYRTGSHWQ
jgi:hypothetical protein